LSQVIKKTLPSGELVTIERAGATNAGSLSFASVAWGQLALSRLTACEVLCAIDPTTCFQIVGCDLPCGISKAYD
jgi:hypothetical protein